MTFSLEAVNARHGDALILHYGEESKRQWILIDGGPPGVYQETLRPRLNQIRQEHHPEEPLPIRLMVVSHIDEDHISGVLELARDIEACEDSGQETPFDVLSLWHNSFQDLTGQLKDAEFSRVVSLVAGADLDLETLPIRGVGRDTLAIVASVEQGRRLQQIADKLCWNLNPGFTGLVSSRPAKPVRKMAPGLSFRVLGPTARQLEKLQEEWAKKIAALKKKGKLKPTSVELAQFLDQSVYNLSSIVFLAEYQGKTMLLSGDARGDFILGSLAEAGLLAGGTFHVDLFKLPHHGSIRNVDADFFRQITADHYIISADGKFGNPDKETLELLIAARNKERFTIYMTNNVPRATNYLKQAKETRNFSLVVRKPKDPGIMVSL